MIVERHFTLSALKKHSRMKRFFSDAAIEAIIELIDSKQFSKLACIALQRVHVVRIQEIPFEGENMWAVTLVEDYR